MDLPEESIGILPRFAAPAESARDLTLLDPKYRVVKVQPVDMFPHTQHVENVVLLKLR